MITSLECAAAAATGEVRSRCALLILMIQPGGGRESMLMMRERSVRICNLDVRVREIPVHTLLFLWFGCPFLHGRPAMPAAGIVLRAFQLSQVSGGELWIDSSILAFRYAAVQLR